MERKITFGDYALSWLDRQVLKPSTYDSYKAILTKHLLPAFGHVPFASLTRPMLKDYLERKQASNRWARQTIHNVRTVLRGIIADAHDSGYVTTNIADRLRLKRRQVPPVSSWGEKEDTDQHFSPLEWEEVQHLLAVARDRYLYPYRAVLRSFTMTVEASCPNDNYGAQFDFSCVCSIVAVWCIPCYNTSLEEVPC